MDTTKFEGHTKGGVRLYTPNEINVQRWGRGTKFVMHSSYIASMKRERELRAELVAMILKLQNSEIVFGRDIDALVTKAREAV